MIPMDAEGYLNGSYVKIGRHNKVFYWHEGEWIKSNKNPVIVRGELNKKKNPFKIGE